MSTDQPTAPNGPTGPSGTSGVGGMSGEGSDPSDADGQMNDQDMPTTDGQMASNTSEEVIPPQA